MNVLLTSFQAWNREPEEGYDAFSIAVYQPDWLPRLPETSVFDIRVDGKWTRPRNFVPEDHDPTQPDMPLLAKYRDALYQAYSDRKVSVGRFLDRATKDLALCCWCPYDKAAQRQIHDYGGFVCHSAVVEAFLLDEFMDRGLTVIRDADRERMVTFT